MNQPLIGGGFLGHMPVDTVATDLDARPLIAYCAEPTGVAFAPPNNRRFPNARKATYGNEVCALTLLKGLRL